MATVIEAEERVKAVHLEGLALMKIVKHCHESLPQMVSGSLLGLSSGGVLEITHAFPFPEPRNEYKSDFGKGDGEDGADDDAAGLEGHEFQLEMMRMLREVNVDNNCVGWYQSMYLGSFSTAASVENQLSYQTDLSPNAVVIFYDPMQTTHGNLVLKCYRLTEECIKIKASGKNVFIDPKSIFEEIPITIVNPGLVNALLLDISEGMQSGERLATDTTFDRLDLSTNPYLEKHLEFLCSWVDDLAAEQHKFQYYTRGLSRGRSDRRKARTTSDDWTSSDAPSRMESLLIANQISTYCDQVDKFAGGGFSKLFLAQGLHKEENSPSSA